MGSEHNPLFELYIGATVRIPPDVSRPPGVPSGNRFGLVVGGVETGEKAIKLLVEIWDEGEERQSLFDAQNVQLYRLPEAEVRRRLHGRKVRFPRSSGIGIDFPEGAADVGRICGLTLIEGKVVVTIVIEVEGARAPFVTPVDFSQIDLVFRSDADDTG